MKFLSTLRELCAAFPAPGDPRPGFLPLERKLREELGLKRAFLFLRAGQGFEASTEGKNPPPLPPNLAAQLQKSKKPLRLRDKGDWSIFWPLYLEGRLEAFFALGPKTQGAWGPEEETLLDLIADRTALYLREKRDWENLQRSDRQSSLGLLSAVLIHEIRNPLT